MSDDASPEWLDLLETTVRRATEEIGRLRADNGTLRDRVSQLEDELADAQEAVESSPDEAAEAAEAWQAERGEIRGRVEKLTEKLEGLLDESDG